MTRERERGTKGVKRAGSWTRLLQGAAMWAVAASVPAAWSAGVEVNNVAAGSAAVTRAGNTTTITTASRNTIINYQRLSVASNETLQFVQPTATSRVLNRIQGSEPTVIDGTLQSNGRVYLVNPAGVMFGNGAVVNVGGLYAAAGHISDANFLAGINQFTDNTGVVRNQGVLRADQIHLVGASVANFGQIVTNGSGIITLTAGKDVYIGETDSPTGTPSVLVRVSSDTSAAKEGTGVTNSGTVDAGAGVLAMGAGDLYAAGIYNNGVLKAKDIKLDSHASTNVNEGTIDASNATGKGGTVEMLGDKVGVFAGAIDASGATGGGSIKIGGDLHGGGGLPVSTVAVVAEGATVRADATEIGDGGAIVVFSSQYTGVGGLLTALPAPDGVGGFIETSGLQGLVIGQAPLVGNGGTWLLDPYNLTISSSASAHVDASFTAIASGANINISDLAAGLASGNVTISTGGTNGGEAGTIHWQSGANLTSLGNNARTLTLSAGSTITLDSDIQLGGANHLTLWLTTGGDVIINGDIDTNGRSIACTGSAFTINGVLTLGNGDLTANVASISQSSGASITADVITLNLSGNADLTAAGNNLNTLSVVENTSGATVSFVNSSALSLGGSTLTATDFSVQAGGDLTVSGAVANSGGTVTLISNGFIAGGSGSLSVGSTGVIAIRPLTGDVTIGIGGATGTLDLSDADLNIIGTAGTLAFGSAGQTGHIGVQTLDLTDSSIGLVSILGGSGTVTLTDNGPTTPALLVPGDVSITAGQIAATNGGNNAPEIRTTGGSHITLVSGNSIGTSSNRIQIDAGSAAINVNATAGVFLDGLGSPGTLAFEGDNAAASFDVTAAGDINPGPAGGTLTATGTIVLNATGGIGITGALGLATPASISLTTHGNDAAGDIHILIPASGATLSGITFTTSGTGTQTDTVDAAGDFSLLAGSPVATDDALAVHAGGDLFVAGQSISAVAITLAANGSVDASSAILTASSLTLQAGTGGTGAFAVNLTNATLGGAIVTLHIEQDPDLNRADFPALGSTGALTLISHTGVVTLGADENLASLSAQGTTIVLSGNATVSGNMAFTGVLQLPAGATTLTGTGSASNLTIAGAIDGASNDLVTNFSGATVLPGSMALNTLTVNAAGGTVTIGSAGSLTATGDVSIGENLLLNGDFTVISSAGAAVFNGTIDSASTASHAALTVNSAGPARFLGDIGATAPLAGLTTDGAGTTVLGNGGAFSIHTGSPITFNTDVILTADTTLTASGGTTGTVTFAKTVNSTAGSFYTLTINADDAVAFQDNVGAVDPLGALVVNATAVGAFLGSSAPIAILTTDAGGAGSQSFNGPLTLLQDTVLLAAGTTGTVAVSGLISSSTAVHYSLIVSSAGDMTFGGGTSTSTTSDLLSIHTLGGGTTRFGGGSSITVLTEGSQTYDGPVALQGNTTFQGSALTFNGTPLSINAATFDLTLISNSMTFAGGADSVTGSAHVTLAPLAAGDNVLVNSTGGSLANTLVIGGSDLAVFGGFALTTIGRADGTGTISLIAATSFATSAQLLTGATGAVDIAAPLSTTGSLGLSTGNVTISDGVDAAGFFDTSAGVFTLNSGTITSSGDITIDNPNGLVTLDGIVDGLAAGTISVTGLGIDVLGYVAGQQLTLDGTAAAVTLEGIVGAYGATAIQGTGVTVGTSSILVGNSILIDSGAGTLTLNSSTTIYTFGSFLTLQGPVVLDGGGTITLQSFETGGTSGAAGDITIIGTVDATNTESLNLWAVNGTSSSANVTIRGVVGGMAHLGGLNVSANVFTIDSDITTSGPVAVSAQHVLLDGTASSTIAIVTGGGAFSTDASIDATGSGTRSLSIITTSSTGAGSIALTSVGTSSTLGALTLNATGSGSAPVQVADVILSGAFSSAGGTFVNNGSIQALSIAISHTGAVNINHDLAATGPVTIDGAAITSLAGASITGTNIAINGTGLVTLQAPVDASGTLLIVGTAGILTGAAGTLTALSATLNGDAGNVTINAIVNATDGFTSSARGYFLLAAGGIQTTDAPVTINHQGSVTLNAPLAAGTGAIAITGASIASDSNGTITGGTVTLLANLAGVSLNALVHATGTLNIAGTTGILTAGGATLAAASVTLNGYAGNVVLNAGVTAAGGFSSTASGAFTLAAGSIQTTNAPVTIAHGGLVTLAGNVNAGSNTVSLTGAGVSQSAGIITAELLSLAGTGTFNLPDANAVGTLTAAVTGNLTFRNAAALDVSGLTTGAGSLTLSTDAGDITFNGTCSAGAIVLTAAHVIVNEAMSGSLLTVASALTTTAPVTIAGPITVNGDADVGAALTATDTSSGFISVTGTVSGIGSLVAATYVNLGGGFSAGGGILAGGSVSITGPVTMNNGSGAITAGSSIALLGGANMTGGLFAGTTIAVTGDSTIHGNMTAGSTISFSAAAVLIDSNATAGGAITIAGPATVSGTFSAWNISVPSSVTLAGSTTLMASSTAGILIGDVAGAASADLTLKASHTASTVTVHAIGADGASIGDMSFDSNGLVVLGGSIYAQSVTFASFAHDDLDKPTGLGAEPTHATIVNDGDLVIVAHDFVTMTRGEKLTVFESGLNEFNSINPPNDASASLLIWAKTGSVTLGDVNVEGHLVVAGDSIIFQQRLAGSVTGGSVQPDFGADIFVLGLNAVTLLSVTPADFAAQTGFTVVSGGTPIRFIGQIAVDTLAYAANPPRYRIGAQNVDNAESLWFANGLSQAAASNLLFVNQSPLTMPTEFVDPGTANPPPGTLRVVRDIEVTGETRNPIAAFGSVIPRDTQTITPERGQAISGALRDYLRTLGIYARDLRPEEIVDYLLGRGLYDDVPYELNPGQGSYQVAVNRLPYAPVLPLVDAARALLQKPVLDENGKPVLDQNGKPEYVSQVDAVSRAIGEAWEAYRTDMGAKNQEVKPLEFRAYLETHDSDPKMALALKYLDQIRDLLARIKNLGLTNAEYQVSQNTLLEPLRFANVPKDDFPLMINGPSSRSADAVVTTPPAPAASGPQ